MGTEEALPNGFAHGADEHGDGGPSQVARGQRRPEYGAASDQADFTLPGAAAGFRGNRRGGTRRGGQLPVQHPVRADGRRTLQVAFIILLAANGFFEKETGAVRTQAFVWR